PTDRPLPPCPDRWTGALEPQPPMARHETAKVRQAVVVSLHLTAAAMSRLYYPPRQDLRLAAGDWVAGPPWDRSARRLNRARREIAVGVGCVGRALNPAGECAGGGAGG